MQRMTLEEFHAAQKAQGVKDREDIAVMCPCCRTVQSARDLIDAGAGATFDEVAKYLGFSCYGRWTRAPSPRREPDGKPCNWTLGGLFHMHELVVVTDDGAEHPTFMPATPEQAQQLMVEHFVRRNQTSGHAPAVSRASILPHGPAR